MDYLVYATCRYAKVTRTNSILCRKHFIFSIILSNVLVLYFYQVFTSKRVLNWFYKTTVDDVLDCRTWSRGSPEENKAINHPKPPFWGKTNQKVGQFSSCNPRCFISYLQRFSIVLCLTSALFKIFVPSFDAKQLITMEFVLILLFTKTRGIAPYFSYLVVRLRG